eukprot:3105068-Pyramimonas_sp.AAC.1
MPIWFRCGQRALGPQDDNGDLLLNPTRFVTSAVALAYALEVRCSQDHGHGEFKVEAACQATTQYGHPTWQSESWRARSISTGWRSCLE